MNIRTLKSTTKDIALHGLAAVRELMGAESRFGIRGAYEHRDRYCYFDDTALADEYQKEVYVRAAEIARDANARTVYDIGCGSGYKLVNYLGQYDTVGFDVPETLEFLHKKYPDRSWAHVPFSDRSRPPADLVICSDVIEHVLDPDELVGFLLSVTRKWLVLSTPDRGREYPTLSRHQLGPPHTDHHIREWNFKEFRRYIDRFVDVHEHVHPNAAHATQMIVATRR
ncbi:MAG: class I SAM-dependent methyltransferase [Ramlibacter sp.]|nr:methyltransferase domain-containing protein [Ramlibacter sp.]